MWCNRMHLYSRLIVIYQVSVKHVISSNAWASHISEHMHHQPSSHQHFIWRINTCTIAIDVKTHKKYQLFITSHTYSGSLTPRPQFWRKNKLMRTQIMTSMITANTATIGLSTHHPNGLYNCLASQRHFCHHYAKCSIIKQTSRLYYILYIVVILLLC